MDTAVTVKCTVICTAMDTIGAGGTMTTTATATDRGRTVRLSRGLDRGADRDTAGGRGAIAMRGGITARGITARRRGPGRR